MTFSIPTALASKHTFLEVEEGHFEKIWVEKVQKDFEKTNRLSIPKNMAWSPPGSVQNSKEMGCDGFELESELLKYRLDLVSYRRQLEKFFNRCGNQLSRQAPSPLYALIKERTIRYDYHKVLKTENLVLRSPEGFVYRGVFVPSVTSEPRPLVIVQCGIYCNLDAPSLLKMLMVFHDESHFNVLMLGSVTGSDFQKENKVFTAGGFDEGRKLFRWAQFLRSDKFHYKSRISSLHLVAYSHGAHSSLYASLFNSYVRLKDGRPYINSFFTGCAPIDLKSSSQFAYRDSLMGRIIYYLFKTQLLDVMQVVPVIRDLIPSRGEIPGRQLITHFVAKASLESYRRWARNPLFTFDPLRNVSVQTQDDFWYANNFSNFSRLGEGPVLMWASLDDPVVDTRTNVLKFLNDQGPGSQVFQGIVTPLGGHCSFDSMYGWKIAAAVMRSHIFQNSPEFSGYQTVLRPLSYIRQDSLKNPNQVLGFQWRYHFKKRQVEMVAKEIEKQWVASGQGRVNSAGTYQTRIVDRVGVVDFDNLPMPSYYQNLPKTELEAEMLTRWMNANLRMKSPSGLHVWPSQVERIVY